MEQCRGTEDSAESKKIKPFYEERLSEEDCHIRQFQPQKAWVTQPQRQASGESDAPLKGATTMTISKASLPSSYNYLNAAQNSYMTI